MKFNQVKINELKTNENNPRVIKDEKFKKLVKSIKEFPKMLELRPVIVNKDMVILGGNMRYKACIDAGLKEIPVVIADDLTEKEQQEFIVKDNVGFGEWDWSILANEWDNQDLKDWGLDVWEPEEEADYSVLDDLDLDNELDELRENNKRFIQIAVEASEYEEVSELVKKARIEQTYLGHILLDALKANV